MYSYKNCYGLSDEWSCEKCFEEQYSYKNCYGLSLCYCSCTTIIFLYSYKNCYGLSCTEKLRKYFKLSIRTKIVMVYQNRSCKN